MTGSCKLGDNLWFYRNKFLFRDVQTEENLFQVFNKYKSGKLTDFCFEVTDLKSLNIVLKMFEEECKLPVVPDVTLGYVAEEE